MKRTFYANVDGGRWKFLVAKEEELLNIARENGNPDATIEEVIEHLTECFENDTRFYKLGTLELHNIVTTICGYKEQKTSPNNTYEIRPPCKACGSEFALLHVMGINYPGENVYFECRDCGARTPMSGTRDEALELWKDGTLIHSSQRAQEETAQECSELSVFESALTEIKKRYCFLETSEERTPAHIGSYQGELMGLARAQTIIRNNDDCSIDHVLNLLDEQIDRYAPEWLKEESTYLAFIIGVHTGIDWARYLLFHANQRQTD